MAGQFTPDSRTARRTRPPTGETSEYWSMDLMADQLVGGQRLRLLT